MIRGAAASLSAGGVFALYGPFRRDGQHTSDSNEAFDRSLRERNPHMGIRDLEAMDQVATAAGLVRGEVQAMPANNFMVMWHHPVDRA